MKKAKKRENLSDRICLPEKYRLDGTYWLRDVPERIKIQRRAENESRLRMKEWLERVPEPGMGLDGYPLQGKKKGG